MFQFIASIIYYHELCKFFRENKLFKNETFRAIFEKIWKKRKLLVQILSGIWFH